MFTSENKNPACLEIPEKSNSQTGNSRRAKKVRAKNFPDLISLQLVEESPIKTEHNFHNKFFLSDIVCVFQYHRHCTFFSYTLLHVVLLHI